ncbi:MAG: hypothetical protein WAU15_01860 [Nitrosomonas sp.]
MFKRSASAVPETRVITSAFFAGFLLFLVTGISYETEQDWRYQQKIGRDSGKLAHPVYVFLIS